MIQTDERFEIKFIDASRLSTIGRCEARFLFKDLMGLRAPDLDTFKMDYGTIMHVVLPFMYGGDSKKAFRVFDDLWARFGFDENDPKRNTEISKRRIENFIRYHTKDACPYEILHFPFSTPSALISENEVPFLIDIGAIYPYCGRIDAPVKWKATGKDWGYEFKTTSELSNRYFDGFWLSPQAVGYTLALSQLMGKRIEGLLYEGMRISEKTIESQLGFCYVSEANIRTFVDEAKLTCARIEAANESGAWRQNHSLCSTYACFGHPSYTCEYKLICDCPEWRDGARFFERQKPFNPLDVKKELER